MRRSTRKSLVNFTLFFGLLATVLYLNRPQSKRTYQWTTIRYRTISTQFPLAHGRCRGLEDTAKPVLVMSHVAADGDLTWLNALTDKYHLCIYDVDGTLPPDTTSLRVPANRGHEAMAYLTFIIDNYHLLSPATPAIVFVHGARWAWHNDHQLYDNRALLSALNVSAALTPSGYHNLRCDWSAGTCDPVEAAPQHSLETSARALLEPWNARAVSDAALPSALQAIFSSDKLSRSDAIRAQCCAQFVVGLESIRRHSRHEYMALRQWLLDDGPKSDRVVGRVLSYVWHVLFLKMGTEEEGVDLQRLNRLACPRAEECYCRLYGRCELDGCAGPGSCVGEYRLPRDMKLPDDWAIMSENFP